MVPWINTLIFYYINICCKKIKYLIKPNSSKCFSAILKKNHNDLIKCKLSKSSNVWFASNLNKKMYVVKRNFIYHYLTVALSCGGSASENQTYLVQSSVTTLTNPCSYTICPCGANICRIRFDFTVSSRKKILTVDQNNNVDKIQFPKND